MKVLNKEQHFQCNLLSTRAYSQEVAMRDSDCFKQRHRSTCSEYPNDISTNHVLKLSLAEQDLSAFGIAKLGRN